MGYYLEKKAISYLKSVNIKYTNLAYLEDKINKEEIYINGESENKSFSLDYIKNVLDHWLLYNQIEDGSSRS